MGSVTALSSQWTAMTNVSILSFNYTTAGEDEYITSVMCQLGSGIAGKTVVSENGTEITPNGKGGYVYLKAAGSVVSDQIYVENSVDVEKRGQSTKPVSMGYYYNIGGKSNYNVTFDVGLYLKANTTTRFDVVVVSLNGRAVLTARRYNFQNIVFTIKPKVVNPTTVELNPSSINLTDKSGAAKNDNAGVKIGPEASINITARPNDCTITSVAVSGDNIVTDTAITSNNTATITVNASDFNTDNVTKQATVTLNGGTATNNFNVNFQEKIKQTSVINNNVIMNLLQVIKNDNKTFTLSNSQNGARKVGLDSFPSVSSNSADFSLEGNNLILPNGLSLNSDSEWFSINRENTPIKLYWNFYNNNVQEYWSTVGTYKNTLDTTFTYSITPILQSQLSYSWNTSETIPDIVLVKQQTNLTINKLVYTNESPYGGCCRGFEIALQNDSTGETYIYNHNVIIDKYTNKTEYNGDIFEKAKNDISLGLYSVKIRAYFYFNDNTSKYYYGAEKTLTQKLLFISDEKLLPELIFPELTIKNGKYTHMMLSAVERYGYAFDSDFINYVNSYQNVINIQFGLNINGKDYPMNSEENQKYFSSLNLTSHLVFNAGRFAIDNILDSSDTEMTVKPYIIVLADTVYARRITAEDVKVSKIINSITDISRLDFWTRPLISKSDYLTYFDAEKFENYVNKYKVLYNNQIQSLPKNKQGDLVSVDFWESVAEELGIYSDNMYYWSTDATNLLNLWAIPQFLHKKGEVITNDNLYQNFWDLLNQCSGAEGAFTTHDFLKNNSLTHNYLHNFTHYQITFKRGLI